MDPLVYISLYKLPQTEIWRGRLISVIREPRRTNRDLITPVHVSKAIQIRLEQQAPNSWVASARSNAIVRVAPLGIGIGRFMVPCRPGIFP